MRLGSFASFVASGGLAIACSSSGSSSGGGVPTTPGTPPANACGSAGVTCTKLQAVASKVMLPTNSSAYALDIDGDGKPDNGLGTLLGALASSNVVTQALEDDAVAQGKIVVLFDESSVDAAFASDPGSALARVLSGTPHPSPDFGGTGAFTVAPSPAPASYFGPIAAGVFSSSPAAPATTSAPVVTLGLAFAGATPVAMPLYAAHLTLGNTSGKATSAQLNGAFKQSDIDGILIPALAADLTATIKADPTSSTSKQLESLYDGGNCTDPGGAPAAANDGVIAPCEISSNALVKSVLAPDVRAFDDAGAWHPTASGAKNGMSVGVAFTLVAATF